MAGAGSAERLFGRGREAAGVAFDARATRSGTRGVRPPRERVKAPLPPDPPGEGVLFRAWSGPQGRLDGERARLDSDPREEGDNPR